MIENTEDKNPKNNLGDTPLHLAAKSGHFEVCKLIIENTEDINSKNDFGRTPIHEAASCGHFEVSKLIIEKNRGQES